MKFKKTNKLFFNKFLYKISIISPIAGTFRSSPIGEIKETLLEYQDRFNTEKKKSIKIGAYGWGSKFITLNDLNIGLAVLSMLEDKDVKFRVEGNVLGIYVNEEYLITNIQNISNVTIREIFKPYDSKIGEFLKSEKDIIIRKTYTHKYKVSVSGLKSESKNFVEWAEKLPKIKLSSSNYRWPSYFYVSDEKTLSMCRLFLGGNIKKIERLCTVSEIS